MSARGPQYVRAYNWINALNDFYTYIQSRPLPSASISLYNYLLYLSSRAYWPQSWDNAISPSLAVLASGCGLGLSSIKIARADLYERHIISYRAQGANRHALYLVNVRHFWDLADPELLRNMDSQSSDNLSLLTG